MALIGKFTFGFLADRLHHKRVFLANLAVMLTGAILLATVRVELFWPAVIPLKTTNPSSVWLSLDW